MDGWAEIGGALGFIQFPASDTEPAKSGPAVARHLQRIYVEFLRAFDQTLMRRLTSGQQRAQQLQALHLATQRQTQGQSPAGAMPLSTGQNVAGAGSSQSQQLSTPPSNLQEIKAVLGLNEPQQINDFLQYSFMTVPALQQRGVPAATIALVEKHRLMMQRFIYSHIEFRKQLQQVTSTSASANGQIPPQVTQNMGAVPIPNQQAQQQGVPGMVNAFPQNVAARPSQQFERPMNQMSGPSGPSGGMPGLHPGMNVVPQQAATNATKPGPAHPGGLRPPHADMQNAMELVKTLKSDIGPKSTDICH